MSEGRSFITASKATEDNTDEKLYAEISIYVKAPDGYSVDEAKLEDNLKTAIQQALSEAVEGAATDAPVEVTNPAVVAPAQPDVELPADNSADVTETK